MDKATFSHPVGVTIIGLGKWSRQLAKAVIRTPSLSIVTCFSRSPEGCQAFAAEFGCDAAPSLEAALTARGVEAAIIAAPGHTHCELTLACARCSVHVFVEKPMAISIEQGIEMARACEHAHVTLMVGHEFRRFGTSRAMKRVLEEGRLGGIVMAVGSFSFPGNFHPDNYRSRRATNRGGALMQLGIHHVETLRYLLGPVVSVRGLLAHVRAPADIDDVGIAELTFENGMIATVNSTFFSPTGAELHIYGEKAHMDCMYDMLAWPDALKVDPTSRLTIQTRETREAIPFEPQDVLALQLDEFARCVRGQAQPEIGAEEGLAALAVAEAALRSSGSGASIDPRSLTA
jgi:predicted dehydrogenase